MRERMLACIQANAQQDAIEKITVMCEQGKQEFSNSKISCIPCDGRATFAELLHLAEARCSAATTHYAVANTDIFLTADLPRLLSRLSASSSVAAVTRTEMDGKLYANPKVSQDLWIFRAHRPTARVLEACGYQLGIAGCEHMFAMALYTHGYEIWNPCLDCRIVHNDPTPKSQWNDQYYGAYLYLPPCTIDEIEKGKPAYEIALSRQDFTQLSGPVGSSIATVQSEAPLRLHLCCGDKKLPGFLGVDIRREVHPEIVASVDRLEMIEEGSVDELYFCHGLEQIAYADAWRCLLELNRVLKIGGLLRLALPDFEALSRLYVAGFSAIDEIRPAIHGGQDYEQNIHYASWDFRSLSSLLTRCGFADIRRYQAKEFLPDNYFDWSLHSLHGLTTSLNVLCAKRAVPPGAGRGGRRESA